MSIYVEDLPNDPGSKFLHCKECDCRYSATRADYFLHDDDEPLECGGCGAELRLAELRLVYLDPPPERRRRRDHVTPGGEP